MIGAGETPGWWWDAYIEQLSGGIGKSIVDITCFILTMPISYRTRTKTDPRSDFFLEIAKGDIDGYSSVHKFGENSDIDTSYEDVWDGGGDYSWLSAGELHNIASTSACDTSGSIGAWTLEIQGLNTSGCAQTETLTLDGTNDVPTTACYLRIFRMKVLTAGTNGINSGNITATALSASTVTAQVSASNNQTLMAIYTVPVDQTGYLTGWYATLSKKISATSNVRMYWRSQGQVFQLKESIAVSENSLWDYTYGIPLKLDGLTDIKIRADASTNDVGVSAGFDMILVDS